MSLAESTSERPRRGLYSLWGNWAPERGNKQAEVLDRIPGVPHVLWRDLYRTLLAVVVIGGAAPAAVRAQFNAPSELAKRATNWPTVSRLEPPRALRGTEVRVFGTNLPKDLKNIKVKLNNAVLDGPVSMSPDGGSFAFRIPPKTRAGTYVVQVAFSLPDRTGATINVPIPDHGYEFCITSEW